MNLCILLATLHRPEGLRRALDNLETTAPDARIVIAADGDDHEAHQIAIERGAKLVICREKRRGPAYAWNEALRIAPNYDAYVLGSDDCIFQPGWLEIATAKLAEIGGSGFVGLRSKKYGHKDLSAFYLMTRDFIVRYHGGVAAVPHYTSWYIDAEASGRAQLAGCYTKTDEVLVIHDWRGPDGDEAYRIGSERREENKALYEQRRAAGFPDDFPRILESRNDE
jgi:glycosyltransferase involved in cell wall biosynthesis